MRSFIQFLVLSLALLLLSVPVGAAGDEWNRNLVERVLAESGITLQPRDGYDGGEGVGNLMEAEAYVEVARFDDSGVRLLKKNKSLENSALQSSDIAEWLAVRDVEAPNGEKFILVEELSPEEVERMRMEANGTPPELIANMMSGMSQGLLMLGEGLETALGDSLAGTPFGPLIATDMRSGSGMYKLPNSPEGHAELCVSLMEEGLSTDPDRRKFESDMFLFGILPNGQFSPVLYTLGPACMLAYSAAQLREGVGSTAAQRAAARAKAMEEVKKIASIVGTEEIDGQPTQHVRVTGISQSQVMEDGTQVTIDQMDVWIDPEYLKRRKFRIEGTMVQNGESRRFFMERENQDYRRVGESFLYEPYLEVMRVGGVLSKEQRAELAEAQKQLAEFDKQLASMPPSQRAMMEKMMGSQMQQMRSLVDGGAVEIRIVTTDIIINPDLRQQGMTTSLGAAPDTSRSLVQMIQTSLATLGYQPGPATGELTKATVVAISRFQAEKGMEVTGQATPQLAGILQAEVEARR